MPSEFFNQLVQARREGTAPPQLAQPTAGAGGGADVPSGERSNAAEVTFRPPSEGVPLVCSGCGVLVDAGAVPLHADTHRQQST